MEKCRGIIFVLVIAIVVTVTALPCPAGEEDKKDKDEKTIFTEDEPREYRQGRERFELTDEEIDRMLDDLKQRDPKKAKELAGLREKDPEKLRDELRRHARDEYGKIVGERIEKWRQQRRADFLKWLGKNVPKVAEELAKLKDKDPDLYTTKYDLVRRKYYRPFRESERHPELAVVLLEDLKLQERRNELVTKIKAAKSESEKKRLTAQLQKVLSDRYDLIVRRKQLAYERLLKWLERLRGQIRESRAELIDAQKKGTKAENIKERTKILLEGVFSWD